MSGTSYGNGLDGQFVVFVGDKDSHRVVRRSGTIKYVTGCGEQFRLMDGGIRLFDFQPHEPLCEDCRELDTATNTG